MCVHCCLPNGRLNRPRLHLRGVVLQTASKAQQAETKSINQSLSAFNTCLQRLWHNQTSKQKSVIIPVRDSALTRILADMMTGHGRLVLSAHISVEEVDLEQTLRTLEFASRVSAIKCHPAVKLPQNLRLNKLVSADSHLVGQVPPPPALCLQLV
jgi:Kinesin motor domain